MSEEKPRLEGPDLTRGDFGLAYVGHAERFDRVEIDGELNKCDCTVTYGKDGQKLATALVHRDLAGLNAEVDFERTPDAASKSSEKRI